MVGKGALIVCGLMITLVVCSSSPLRAQTVPSDGTESPAVTLNSDLEVGSRSISRDSLRPHRRVLGRKVRTDSTGPHGTRESMPHDPVRERSSQPRDDPRTAFTFVCPLSRPRVTSPFGMRKDPKHRKKKKMHKGIDYGAPRGTPVVATGPAKVLYAGRCHRGAGICVILRHDAHWVSRYFHLSKVEVRAGTRVKGGELIGRVGSTGRSTGPHLHFEIRRDRKPVDPATLIGTRSPDATTVF